MHEEAHFSIVAWAEKRALLTARCLSIYFFYAGYTYHLLLMPEENNSGYKSVHRNKLWKSRTELLSAYFVDDALAMKLVVHTHPNTAI
jgi:hypothetical protein